MLVPTYMQRSVVLWWGTQHWPQLILSSVALLCAKKTGSQDTLRRVTAYMSWWDSFGGVLVSKVGWVEVQSRTSLSSIPGMASEQRLGFWQFLLLGPLLGDAINDAPFISAATALLAQQAL